MEVIVKDTNIIIDLYNTGLLPYCEQLDIEFHITIDVYRELNNTMQKEMIDKLIEEHKLHRDELSGEYALTLQLLIFEQNGKSNLSPTDCSVIILAEKLGCRLLTGDQKLKHQAIERGIQVNGVLWIVKKLVDDAIVSPEVMIGHLQRLKDTNISAPQKEIDSLINKYSKNINAKY